MESVEKDFPSSPKNLGVFRGCCRPESTSDEAGIAFAAAIVIISVVVLAVVLKGIVVVGATVVGTTVATLGVGSLGSTGAVGAFGGVTPV